MLIFDVAIDGLMEMASFIYALAIENHNSAE
jgi:hypothetical protein